MGPSHARDLRCADGPENNARNSSLVCAESMSKVCRFVKKVKIRLTSNHVWVCNVTCHATVAPAFVSLHVAAHGEGLAAAVVRASEGLLARVAVCVNLQARWSAEGFVARGANVAVLRLWKRGL